MGCGASAENGSTVKVHPVQALLIQRQRERNSALKVQPIQVVPAAPQKSQTFNDDKNDMPSLFPKSRTSIKGVRTTLDSALNSQEALEELRKGNRRYLAGDKSHGAVTHSARVSLATDGQSPMAAIIGCADSRVPVEIVFDAQPGDLFILRNAGNTCMCAEGSIVGSTEYCIGHLRTPLIVVMGHTKCGALAGATQLACAPKIDTGPDDPPSRSSSKQTMLESLLTSLEPAVTEAYSMLPKDACIEEITGLAIRRNVFQTMRSLLKYSDMLRDKVRQGSVHIEGAVYDIMTGEVEFLGPLLDSK